MTRSIYKIVKSKLANCVWTTTLNFMHKALRCQRKNFTKEQIKKLHIYLSLPGSPRA